MNGAPCWWKIALWAVSILWAVLQRPYGFGLQPYIFFDSGWALTTNQLLDEGLIPTRDFAYFYGLLTLVIDRVWFGAFGATPLAQGALSLVCAAASTHAVVRFASAAALGPRSRILLLICAPLAIMPSFYPTPTHALEHALLINALACQAKGRCSTALVLATVCLFVKPTLAGFYGLILLGLILFDPANRLKPLRARLRELLPSGIVGLALAALLVARFGVEPLVATLVPVDAARVYDAENYGFFFGTGRRFWLPDREGALFYPFLPGPFWLAGTLVLTWGAVRLKTGTPALIATCAALHLIFTFFLFGNDLSWKYYPYPLIFGVCLVVKAPGRTARIQTIVLAALAILGQSLMVLIGASMLLKAAVSEMPERTPATAGLLASREDQESWARVRAIAASDRVMILSPVSAGRVLMPEVTSPSTWFLLRPIARRAEIERVNAQIESANWLVIPTGPGTPLTSWPEFAESLRPFRIVEQHSSFDLARRFPAK